MNMERRIIKIPYTIDEYDEIFIKINGKMVNDAGFRPGELMTVEVDNGRIAIERNKENTEIERIAETYVKPKSYYDGGYKGYRVDLRLERNNDYEPAYLSNAAQVYDFLKPLQYEPRESVLSVMLDTKNKVVGVHESARGGIESATLTPFDALQGCFLNNSHRLILAHNHPSGDPEPSKPDFDITDKIKKACDIMRMDLLDHIIIGYDKYISFRDKGYL